MSGHAVDILCSPLGRRFSYLLLLAEFSDSSAADIHLWHILRTCICCGMSFSFATANNASKTWMAYPRPLPANSQPFFERMFFMCRSAHFTHSHKMSNDLRLYFVVTSPSLSFMPFEGSSFICLSLVFPIRIVIYHSTSFSFFDVLLPSSLCISLSWPLSPLSIVPVVSYHVISYLLLLAFFHNIIETCLHN